MPTSWTQLHVHFVWSTKRREPLIDADLDSKLHPSLGGIARDMGCTCVIANGTPDHVHMLVQMKADLTVSDLARHLKSRSSKWIHDTDPARHSFAWQAGYGAFTVSESMLGAITNYIRDQKIHHLKFNFEREFMRLLEVHGMTPRRDEVFQDEE